MRTKILVMLFALLLFAASLANAAIPTVRAEYNSTTSTINLYVNGTFDFLAGELVLDLDQPYLKSMAVNGSNLYNYFKDFGALSDNMNETDWNATANATWYNNGTLPVGVDYKYDEKAAQLRVYFFAPNATEIDVNKILFSINVTVDNSNSTKGAIATLAGRLYNAQNSTWSSGYPVLYQMEIGSPECVTANATTIAVDNSTLLSLIHI